MWKSNQMEMEILICDDDADFVEFEKEGIQKAAERYQKEVWISFYENGRELIKALEKKEKPELCVVLLDIDMPELSGYEVAKILTQKYPNMLLLFVSDREDLVYEAFEYRPFRFIRKRCFELEIRHALRKAFEVVESRIEKNTVLKSNGQSILLEHSDILYLLVFNRKVSFHLQNDKCIEVRYSMKAVLAELNDTKFVQINSGCAVNSDYVKSYNSDTIVLKNGEKLPMSRDRAKNVKMQIEKNWRK